MFPHRVVAKQCQFYQTSNPLCGRFSPFSTKNYWGLSLHGIRPVFGRGNDQNQTPRLFHGDSWGPKGASVFVLQGRHPKMDTVQNLRPRGTAKLGCFQIFGTNMY